MVTLGKIKEIKDLREAWPNEALDFTPWLAKNISILGEAVGIDISGQERESPVGNFSADIFATDSDNGRKIIIENQLEDTDHDHLGKLITYASGKDAELIIWIVKKARAEHSAAIEWLNNHTDDDIGFILCEIKLYQIEDSLLAPKFEIIEMPNNWIKEMKNSGRSKAVLPKIKDMLEWGVVKPGDILVAKNTDSESELLEDGQVLFNNEKMSIQQWLQIALNRSSIGTYLFAVHKASNRTLSSIREEYMKNMESEE